MNMRDTGVILDSELLLRTRLQRGLSQRQLARAISLSAPVIGRLEAGKGHGSSRKPGNQHEASAIRA